MTSNTDQYISSGQTKKLLSFGLVAMLSIIPLSQIPIVPNIITLILGAFTTLVLYIITVVLEGIIGVIGTLFAFGTQQFLFFEPPGNLDQLESVWSRFLVVYWALMPVAGGVFFLGMQLFPEKEEANIYRFMERFMISVIVIIIANPYLPANLDAFSLGVTAVNEIGRFVFPTTYTIGFLGNDVNLLVGSLMGATAGGAAVIGVGFVGWKFLIGILLTILTFYVVLAMRMLLVYTTYAMLPFLMSLWVVDIGPLKYGKMVAEMVFKITGMLLLLGVIISGILATTDALAGDTQAGMAWEGPDGETSIDEDDMETGTDTIDGADTDEISGEAEDRGGEASEYGLDGGAFLIFFRIMAWAGGMVLVVALCTSMLGMLLSAGGASRNLGGGGAKAGKGGAAGATGVKTYGGGGDSSDGSGIAGLGDSPEITHTDDATIIQGEDSDSGLIIGDDGSVSTFDNSETVESHSLRDKAKYNAGRVGDKIKDIDENSDYTSGRASDMVDSVGGMASSAGETVSGVKNTVTDNLGFKAGKAYWDVFKQPDFVSSVGKARELASGVGAPTEPDPQEQGPTSDEDLGEEAFNTSYQAPPGDTGDEFYDNNNSEGGNDEDVDGWGGDNGPQDRVENDTEFEDTAYNSEGGNDEDVDGWGGDNGPQDRVENDTEFEDTAYNNLNATNTGGNTDNSPDFDDGAYNNLNASNTSSDNTQESGSIVDVLENHDVSSPAGYESFVVSDDDGEEYNVDDAMGDDELGGNRPATDDDE